MNFIEESEVFRNQQSEFRNKKAFRNRHSEIRDKKLKFPIRHLPNAITCANLFCGCIGIVLAFKGDLIAASYAIFISAIFDFLDGLASRALKSYSAIGKDLDSLADVVSFGVLPG